MSSEEIKSENSTDSEDYETLSESSDENLEHSENLELTANILKNYNIICELGRGAFSIVWLAYSICNNNFYALKVQNPNEFNDGLDEINFVKKLPTNPPIFNNLVEYFIEENDNKKYLCSTWELHCSNIDGIIRKGDFTNGFSLPIVKKIMKQLISAVKILHEKFKEFHGDIKSDNILIKGLNDKDKFIIRRYQEENFFEKYSNAKKAYWSGIGKDLSKIDNMSKEDKIKIRKMIHETITNKILEEYHQSDISKHSIDEKYLNEMNVSLGDFGTHCEIHNYYEDSFGTRYYQAPEIILMGKCSLPVDIWALGCTFYELLSGNLLFDPNKDSKHSRDYYHLCLINETCGDFSSGFLKKTKYYKQFFDSKYRIIDYSVPSESRLDRKLNSLELSDNDKSAIKKILKSMLEIDPNKRISINELSKCNFFKN